MVNARTASVFALGLGLVHCALVLFPSLSFFIPPSLYNLLSLFLFVCYFFNSVFYLFINFTDNNQDMDMQVNTTSPSLAVTSSLNNESMSVSMSIFSITELSSSNEPLRTVSITDYKFRYLFHKREGERKTSTILILLLVTMWKKLQTRVKNSP
jgi:hypothetical protein